MNNKVKFIKILSLVCVLGLMTFSIQSCKDDDKPPVVTNDDDNTNPDPLAGKDYLLFEGVKVEFRNPTMGSTKASLGDTTLEWYGNKPSGTVGDTVLIISQPALDNENFEPKPRVAGIYTFAPWPGGPSSTNTVTTRLRWGTLSGRPVVDMTGGTYELKRVDGKWVSILKNGTGTWTKSNGDKVNYTGIEFKATWPN